MPRVGAGFALGPLATAAIDVSDGLLADLGHICKASGCGATIDVERVPLSAELLSLFPPQEALAHALGGGDDYELCFTAPPSRAEEIEAALEAAGTPVRRIGQLVAGPNRRVPPRRRAVHSRRARLSAFLSDLSLGTLRDPVHFIAFGFGAGLAPYAPGTFGSLVGLVAAWWLLELPLVARIAVVLAVIAFGIWICGESARRLNAPRRSAHRLRRDRGRAPDEPWPSSKRRFSRSR